MPRGSSAPSGIGGPYAHSSASLPMASSATQPTGSRTGKGAAGLTLDIQQRKVVIGGGFRCQCEIEAMAALRLITVHNTYCLDQLWRESRGECQCCLRSPAHGPCSAGPAQQSITACCHSKGQAFAPQMGLAVEHQQSHDSDCMGRCSGRRGRMGRLASSRALQALMETWEKG